MYRFPQNTAPGNYWQPSGTSVAPYWTITTWYTNCLKCGAQVSCYDKFCPNCGEALWVAESTEDKLDRVLARLMELEKKVQSLSEKAKKDG